jgi:hypothetical protein
LESTAGIKGKFDQELDKEGKKFVEEMKLSKDAYVSKKMTQKGGSKSKNKRPKHH